MAMGIPPITLWNPNHLPHCSPPSLCHRCIWHAQWSPALPPTRPQCYQKSHHCLWHLTQNRTCPSSSLNRKLPHAGLPLLLTRWRIQPMTWDMDAWDQEASPFTLPTPFLTSIPSYPPHQTSKRNSTSKSTSTGRHSPKMSSHHSPPCPCKTANIC